MRSAFIVSCCGLLTACAEAPLLPEHHSLPPVRVVQVLSDAELAEAQSAWRRCSDCPVVTMKTRMDVQRTQPAPVAIAIRTPVAVVAAPIRSQPLPQVELRFAFKSVTLGALERDALRIWTTSWGPNPAARLRITAYAESTTASRRLCEDRAQAVQSALQSLGIPFTQFERGVEVVSDPARRVVIAVTQLPSKTATAISEPEAVGVRPASADLATAHPSPPNGALP